jgi:hypothetical protein
MKILPYFWILLLVPRLAHADELLFSQKNPDHSTIRITLSSPHPAPTHVSKQLAPNEREFSTTQTWLAQNVSEDGKTSKAIFQFEQGYLDPHEYPSLSPAPPFKILAAKSFDHGLVIVQTKQASIQGYVFSQDFSDFPEQPVLMDTHEVSDTSKFKATIEGEYASKDITTTISAPDGTRRVFRLGIQDGRRSRWTEITNDPHGPSTRATATGPSTAKE